MKAIDKAISVCDEMWSGTFDIIEESLNKVEITVNQAISKRDNKLAEKAFTALRNIAGTIESYRNESGVTAKDKAKLFKLRDKKNSIYNKLVNSKIL